jgi:quercetin dioxygenase-like cupin family protein
MVRFPAGYQEPWHNHTATYRAVLVKGKFQSRARDGSDSITVFGPGSYAAQPGGVVHSEVNAGEGERVALVFFEGSVDFVLAG